MNNTTINVQGAYREWEAAIEEIYFAELRLLEEEHRMRDQELAAELFQ